MRRVKTLWILHESLNVAQRARFLIDRLKGKLQIHVVDFTNFHSLRDLVDIHRQIESLSRYTVKSRRLVTHHIRRVHILPMRYFGMLRALNRRLFKKQINGIIRRQRINAVITSSCEYLPPLDRVPVIFDYIDDHIAYFRDILKSEHLAEEVEHNTSTLLESSDFVCTVSKDLYEEVKLKNKNVALIPNGVDVKEFREAEKALNFGDKTKIIGYIGNFGKFSGLIKLLRTIPIVTRHIRNIKYIIVGGGEQIRDATRYVKRENLENYVTFLGKVSINEVPSIVKSFDVGVIPFDKCQFTDNACPIKIFEYTAAGIPVVSTDLEEIRRLGFSNVFLTGDSVEDLSEKILRTLAMENVDVPWDKLKSYDWNTITLRFSQIIEKVVRGQAT